VGLLDREKRGVWVYYRINAAALRDFGALLGAVAG
jgi:ArsR family transcriptional regulator, arsenate/arsenite/antimonite-responsive transcriptional repressor